MKRTLLLVGLLAAPLLLTGCQEDATGTSSISDGSVEASSLSALMTDLAEEGSDAALGRTEMLARFDTDGDGELSAAEREAAHEAHKAELLERFDADGDGVLSDEEHQTARETIRQEFMSRFDADGDGRFSFAERRQIGRHHPGFGPHHRGHRPPPEDRRQGLLDQFDTDGDGVLSDEEVAALRAEFAASRAG